jgi:hypothetical protein
MPLEVKLKVGDDTFEVKNDAMDAEIVKLAEAWVGALPPASQDDASTAAKVRELRDSVQADRTKLGAAVDSSQPQAGEASVRKA